MKPYVIHVRLREHSPIHEKIVRYAVLASTADEALEVMRSRLAFGDRASVSNETLTPNQMAELALVAGRPRQIG